MSNPNTQLTNVFAASFAQGKNEAATIATVKAAGGNQEPIKHEYWLGRIAASLNKDAPKPTDALRQQALTILGKKGFKDGGEDGRRTLREEQAYAAARSAWKYLLRSAGITSAKKRKPRPEGNAPQPAAETSKETAPIEAAPKAHTRDDVFAFEKQMAEKFAHYLKANAAWLDSDLRAPLALFINAVNRLKDQADAGPTAKAA